MRQLVNADHMYQNLLISQNIKKTVRVCTRLPYYITFYYYSQ